MGNVNFIRESEVRGRVRVGFLLIDVVVQDLTPELWELCFDTGTPFHDSWKNYQGWKGRDGMRVDLSPEFSVSPEFSQNS